GIWLYRTTIPAGVMQADTRNADNATRQSEAKRKTEDSEQQRLAAAKAEEERKAKEAAEVRTRYSALMGQARTELDNNSDNDRVIATANEAIRLDPKAAEAFAIRSRAYLIKGDNDQAIADANAAIRLTPT